MRILLSGLSFLLLGTTCLLLLPTALLAADAATMSVRGAPESDDPEKIRLRGAKRGTGNLFENQPRRLQNQRTYYQPNRNPNRNNNYNYNYNMRNNNFNMRNNNYNNYNNNPHYYARPVPRPINNNYNNNNNNNNYNNYHYNHQNMNWVAKPVNGIPVNPRPPVQQQPPPTNIPISSPVQQQRPPTNQPIFTPSPVVEPIESPTNSPIRSPTRSLTMGPTRKPTLSPSVGGTCQSASEIICLHPEDRTSIFCDILAQLDLESSLVPEEGSGITVFAPTDWAFAKLTGRYSFSIEELKDVFLYHIVPTKGTAPLAFDDLECTGLITTMNGQPTRTMCKGNGSIKYQKGPLNDEDQGMLPEIVVPDIRACGRVIIHLVDNVILPKTVVLDDDDKNEEPIAVTPITPAPTGAVVNADPANEARSEDEREETTTPTADPTTRPTKRPTGLPVSGGGKPSEAPEPPKTVLPSEAPSKEEEEETSAPTVSPTKIATIAPTTTPTKRPTEAPEIERGKSSEAPSDQSEPAETPYPTFLATYYETEWFYYPTTSPYPTTTPYPTWIFYPTQTPFPTWSYTEEEETNR